MKVRLGTIEVTDEERRAISHDSGMGTDRLATREEVRRFFIDMSQGELEAARARRFEYLEEIEEAAEVGVR